MSEQEETIDLRVFLKVFIEHIIPIAAAAIIAALIGFVLAKFVVPKSYTSEAMMYVENSGGERESEALNINDLTVAQKLVSTCQILFKSPDVLASLSGEFHGEYSAGQLDNMITIESVSNTEILKIKAQAESAEAAEHVCAAAVRSSVSEFRRVIKGGSIETVSAPTLPETHTYPSALKFTLIGAAAGFVVLYGIFILKELFDTKVKSGDDLAVMYGIPVFAEILDFETAEKSGYYKYSKYGAYDDGGSNEKNSADDHDDLYEEDEKE